MSGQQYDITQAVWVPKFIATLTLGRIGKTAIGIPVENMV
jgi:hypothetical protein